MRIVYCIDSINRIGGIQRSILIKANALSAIPDNRVWILCADNSGERKFECSPKVSVINLGINYYADDWKSKWHMLRGIFVTRRVHKKKLIVHLKAIQPDFVIGVGQSEKFFLPFLKGNWVSIREFHYTRDYRRKNAEGWFERVCAFVSTVVDRFCLRKYDCLVTLTQEDLETNWQGYNNIVVIPNPSDINPNKTAILEAPRVISIGRLTHQKDFASLIRAFSRVVARFPDWHLDIFGDGPDHPDLLSEINALSLSDSVHLRGETTSVEKELLSSSIFALSSKFEGLPMVLIEALLCGLPVVSYSCPCGPKDIIKDRENGFLVPPENESLLAEKICDLIEDKDLRKKMGENAAESSKQFLTDTIISKWMDLFYSLKHKTCAP